jgi:hypothetical protein
MSDFCVLEDLIDSLILEANESVARLEWGSPSNDRDLAKARAALVEKIEALYDLVQKQEDQLNAILQPGMRWIELDAAHRAAEADGEAWPWWEANGQFLMLARARLIEALREVAGQMAKR